MSSCCDKATEIIVESLDAEVDFLVNKESRSQQRMAICQTCPELKSLNRCQQCGCFMSIKTRIYSARCPLGLW
jgi:hypothetical protein